jgi:hypothetical protein
MEVPDLPNIQSNQMSLAATRSEGQSCVVAILCVHQRADRGRQDGYLPFSQGAYRVAASVMEPPIPGCTVHVREFGAPDVEAMLAFVREVGADVVGGSAYVWSLSALLELAVRLAREPKPPFFVLGGPSARPAVMALAPFVLARVAIGALVVGEGERPMRELVLLEHRTPDRVAQVRGVKVWDGQQWRGTPAGELPALDSLPSPHQMHLAPADTSASLETFRGCPLSCAFCEWGIYEGAGRVFSKEYLIRELTAFHELKTRGAFLADAGLNLNRRALRNLIEAEREVRFFEKKPLATEIYAIAVRKEELDFLASVRTGRIGVGLQTADSSVLERMGRPHDPRRFAQGVQELAKVCDPVVELILGLPGDTPDGFRRSLYGALEMGATWLNVYQCLVLPDGLMTRAPADSNMQFDPHTLRMQSCLGFTPDDFAKLFEELSALANQMGGVSSEAFWEFQCRPAQFVEDFWTESRPVIPAHVTLTTPERPIIQQVFAASLLSWPEGWRLASARLFNARIELNVETPDGKINVYIQRSKPGQRAFVEKHDIAVSYHGTNMTLDHTTTIQLLGSELVQLGLAELPAAETLPKPESALAK